MRIRMGFGFGKRALLRHPLAGFGKIALLLGLFLFLLGIILFVIVGNIENAEARWVMLYAISSQGLVWGVIGLVFTLIVNSHTKKLNDLKQSGKRFAAEITDLSPVVGVNVGINTPTVYAECIYINDQQQRCKVKSPMFLWENYKHDKLQAEVYVDWNNPHRYAVEITRRETALPQVDIDYT